MMGRAQGMVNQHVEERKTERVVDGFQNTKRTGTYAARTIKQADREMNRLKSMRTNKDGTVVGDIKAVTVKTANKTIRVMRQEANLKREQRNNPNAVAPIQDDDSDELALENMLTDIIGRVISLKLNKTDPEFKIFKEHHERGV